MYLYHRHEHRRLLDSHELAPSDSLTQRPVCEETKHEILELFKAGYNASTAYHVFMLDKIATLGDDFELTSADRSKFPDATYFQNLYQQHFKLQFGEKTGELSVSKLIEFAENYNRETPDGKIAWERDGDDVLIAGCTPLMKRTHELFIEAGDVNFVDSTGNFESSGARVFFFICPTAAGGFPLGFGIAPCETADTVEKLFRLLQKCLPDNAFFGRGPERGPAVFLIDGSLSERQALERVWPKPNTLIL